LVYWANAHTFFAIWLARLVQGSAPQSRWQACPHKNKTIIEKNQVLEEAICDKVAKKLLFSMRYMKKIYGLNQY